MDERAAHRRAGKALVAFLEGSETPEARILAVAAGDIAAGRFGGLPTNQADALRDQEEVSELVPTFSYGERAQLQLRAEEIVDEPVHWSAIKELARRIVEDPTMSAEDEQAVLAELLTHRRD